MALAKQTYDSYAAWRAKQIDENPQRFVRDLCPSSFLPVLRDFARAVTDLRGKCALELGSGFGDMAVWLTYRGAEVTALELGPGLVEVSRRVAALNDRAVDFRQGDITQPLPFADESFDLVAGFGILHHLEGEPLKRCVAEVRRVLKPGGQAYFHEPIEDSPAFNFLQNLLPLSGGEPRPSILQRKKWREYMAVQDDRPLTTRELADAGVGFREVDVRGFGLTFRFRRLLGARFDGALDAIDEGIFAVLPFLRRFGQTALIRYRK
jgi:SAM-dependent methyltransferase